MIEPKLKKYYIGFNFLAESSISDEELMKYIGRILNFAHIHPKNLDFHECTKLKTETMATTDTTEGNLH